MAGGGSASVGAAELLPTAGSVRTSTRVREQASQRADRSGGGTEEDGEAEPGTEDMDTQDNAVSRERVKASEDGTNYTSWPRVNPLCIAR